MNVAQANSQSLAATKTVLIINPATVDDASSIADLVRARCRDRGCEEVMVEQITTRHPGSSQARRAVAGGADLVLACGGDGNVAAIADGLAYSNVPMGILSTGTGNLLCRNLCIPTGIDDSLDVALGGNTRVIDLGRIEESHFVVMAGMGFDALVMRDISGQVKTRPGLLAHIVAGLRNLVNRPMFATVRLDGETYVQGAARTILIGNVGRILGGLPLLPAADPCDGQLDVAIVAPRSWGDWLDVVWRVIRRRRTADVRLQRFRARCIEVEAGRSVSRHFDGEVMASSRSLRVEVDPGALAVKVPE